VHMRWMYISLLVSLLWTCSSKSTKRDIELSTERAEAINDSLAYRAALKSRELIATRLKAVIETDPVKSSLGEDAADDPAFWLDKNNPSASVIYGSNKRAGIVAYNLEGREIGFYDIGRVNNIDVVQDILAEDVDIIGGTNRSFGSVDILMIKESGVLDTLTLGRIQCDSSIMDDVYGFCFGKNVEKSEVYAFVNAKNGRLQQYRIDLVGDSLISDLISSLVIRSQPEGMVADDTEGKLYVGEEDRGIWVYDYADGLKDPQLIPMTGEENSSIKFDIEGLAIYQQGEVKLLVASSQGNFSYAVYDIDDGYKYLGSFILDGKEGIDAVEETDGIEIYSDSVSREFPHGIMIAQDGFNYDDQVLKNQNFKVIGLAPDWFLELKGNTE